MQVRKGFSRQTDCSLGMPEQRQQMNKEQAANGEREEEKVTLGPVDVHLERANEMCTMERKRNKFKKNAIHAKE